MAMTASAQPSSHSRARLAYTVRPLRNGDTLEAVSVELRFKGSPTGTTVLDLPKEWGGKTKLYEALSDFSVSGANSRIQAGAEPWERVVHHRAGAWIRVRYVVHHADEGAARQGNPYRPMILRSRLQLLGSTVFAAPHKTDDADSVAVVLKSFRSEEHTSELQSRFDLVCRLLLEKKKNGCVRLGCRRRVAEAPTIARVA